MTKHAGDEEYLEAAAVAALGDEPVLAAGIFSWAGLMAAQMAGTAGGGLAADVIAGGSAGADVVGAVVGGRAAVEATAAAEGMTVALLVAVTEASIHVLRWEGEAAGAELHRFDRATTHVHVSKMGLSRIVKLEDDASGASFELHGSVAPFSVQSKPDKLVMHLLT